MVFASVGSKQLTFPRVRVPSIGPEELEEVAVGIELAILLTLLNTLSAAVAADVVVKVVEVGMVF